MNIIVTLQVIIKFIYLNYKFYNEHNTYLTGDYKVYIIKLQVKFYNEHNTYLTGCYKVYIFKLQVL